MKIEKKTNKIYGLEITEKGSIMFANVNFVEVMLQHGTIYYSAGKIKTTLDFRLLKDTSGVYYQIEGEK